MVTEAKKHLQELDACITSFENMISEFESKLLDMKYKRRRYYDENVRCTSMETFEYHGSHSFDLTRRCTKEINHEGKHTENDESW